jgi:hypothetical protein
MSLNKSTGWPISGTRMRVKPIATIVPSNNCPVAGNDPLRALLKEMQN